MNGKNRVIYVVEKRTNTKVIPLDGRAKQTKQCIIPAFNHSRTLDDS